MFCTYTYDLNRKHQHYKQLIGKILCFNIELTRDNDYSDRLSGKLRIIYQHLYFKLSRYLHFLVLGYIFGKF